MYPNFKWLENWDCRTRWDLHPYNLCLLSAMIDKKYDVKLIDANMDNLTKEEFAEIIKTEKPDVIGISVLTDEYGECGLIAAEMIKRVDSNIKIVLGGVKAISNPKSIVENENIDYVVVGEGEYIFKELCNYFNGEGEFPKRGLMYKKEGQIIDTGKVEFIENLDELPLPSYHKVDFNKYITQPQRESIDRPRELPYAHIITSRGCPYSCCFCTVGSISGKKSRCRSPENIIMEIEFLIKNYGVKFLTFDDDNLLISKERAKKLFQIMIDKQFNLKWNVTSLAVYKLDEELIDLMKRSGCQYVDIAIESGVERVLKEIIHKPLDLEYAKKIIKKLKEAEIDIAANFVIGFPGETWEEIRQTIKFAEDIDVDYVKIFVATPFRNTELYELAKKGGFLVEEFDVANCIWSEASIKTDEFQPEDLKFLRAYEWDRINFSTPKKRKKIAEMIGVTKERLKEIRKSTLQKANN